MVEINLNRNCDCQVLARIVIGNDTWMVVIGDRLSDKHDENSFLIMKDAQDLESGEFFFYPKNGVMYRNERVEGVKKGVVYTKKSKGLLRLERALKNLLPFIMYRLWDTFHPKGVIELHRFNTFGSPYLLNIRDFYLLERVIGGTLYCVLLPVEGRGLKVECSHVYDKDIYDYLKDYTVPEVLILDFSYPFFGKSGIIAEVGIYAGDWRIAYKGKQYKVTLEKGKATSDEDVPAKYLRFVENYTSYVKENKIEWR